MQPHCFTTQPGCSFISYAITSSIVHSTCKQHSVGSFKRDTPCNNNYCLESSQKDSEYLFRYIQYLAHTTLPKFLHYSITALKLAMSDSSVSSTQVAPSATTGIQVQVIPAQTQSAVSNSANPSSLLSTSGDISAQVTQLTGVRLPGTAAAADQQQRLLLAQLQQLSKTNSSIPANASFVLQPTFQGITVVTSAPSTTTSSNEAAKG